jgi:A-factor type gamma-butyrolactone 1'-reductase (1S-forming)
MGNRSCLLADKVTLIVGASSGIGAAAARVFAAEGAHVVLVARREPRLTALVRELRDTGAAAEYAVADVTRADQVAAAVEFTVRRFGRLDAAFNNAGCGVGRVPLHEMADSLYDSMMETNVRGVFNCLRSEIGTMLAGGTGGAIVNTSSIGGLVATPVAATYVAAKHAVLGLTRAAAIEYGANGIRVNAIAPGATDSELLADWLARYPEMAEPVRTAPPQRRIANATEVAEAAAWLCSDRASYVTGVALPVDGGWTAQ